MIDPAGYTQWHYWTELSEFGITVWNPHPAGSVLPDFIDLVPVGVTDTWTFIIDPTDGTAMGPAFTPAPGTYVLEDWTPPPADPNKAVEISIGWPGMVLVN